VAAKIKAEGGECVPLEALAGNRQHAEKTVGEAISRWGRIDALVNNAHTFTDYLPIEDPKMEENVLIDMQSAFLGSLQLMQLCYPHMLKQAPVRSSIWAQAMASAASRASWPMRPARKRSGR